LFLRLDAADDLVAMVAVLRVILRLEEDVDDDGVEGESDVGIRDREADVPVDQLADGFAVPAAGGSAAAAPAAGEAAPAAGAAESRGRGEPESGCGDEPG
jgi:hypothetical protein